jgi:hypothetical protein
MSLITVVSVHIKKVTPHKARGDEKNMTYPERFALCKVKFV